MNPGTWLAALLRASLEGGVLLLVIWGVTRLWPRMPASARCGLWWLGALRMLVGLVPVPTFSVAKPTWTPPMPAIGTPMVDLANAVADGVAAVPAMTATPARSPIDVIPYALMAVWLGGVAIGLVILARRLVSLRRSWRAATPFHEPRIERWRTEWAVVLGPARVPEVRAGADAQVPVAIGGLRPGLLLPANSAALSDDALRMVLAHEMSHVRRRDPLLAWVPAAAQLVFWFHPVVRLAVREYLAAREQACDADALRATGTSPRDYGTLLLDYGVSRVSEVPGAASCGSHGARDLKRRLEMLSRTLRVTAAHRIGTAAVVLAVVAVGFVPIRFVAADDDKKSESDYFDKQAYQREAKAYEEALLLEKKRSSTTKGGLERKKGRSITFDGSINTRRQVAYMIKVRGEKGTRGAISESDFSSAARLDEMNQTLVYFRLGDDMWISRDERVMEQVREALAPEDRLEASQKFFENQNEGFEREQMKLEKERDQFERRKEKLEARREAFRDEVERRRENGRSVDDLRDDMNALEAETDALAQSMNELSTRYDALHEMSKKQYGSSKALNAEMKQVHEKVMGNIIEIARRAIEDGRAEPFEP
ncbi:MAG TPA: M56 family metallopeptidase [Candidatus Eisenbacteria bacterium]|nr:M56 family metallopeptidase [Candidatus Eisenbacteria bacterium]